MEEEGKDLSDQFWKEILEVLVKKNSKVPSILAGQY
jgi:hypothetical protein